MSTQTAALTGHEVSSHATSGKPGFWARVFERMVKAREHEARLRVSQHLLSMPDRQLRDIGFTEQEIHTLRMTGVLPAPSRS